MANVCGERKDNGAFTGRKSFWCSVSGLPQFVSDQCGPLSVLREKTDCPVDVSNFY